LVTIWGCPEEPRISSRCAIGQDGGVTEQEISTDRRILALAVPALGALIAEPLFLLADSAIVGRLGTTELAGLGLAGAILASAVNIFIFLAYGTTSTVARRIGAGDRDDGSGSRRPPAIRRV
jgi:Na+-driven multidrug efflux pump